VVTAVGALILVEDGKLGLDESIERLVPELAERLVLKRIDGPLDDVVSSARDHHPRSAHDAHGPRLHHDTLGVLMARAAGGPLSAFLRDRLFGPLGMKDTAFHVPSERRARLTSAYRVEEGGALALHDAAENSSWADAPAFPSGASCLVSTADDYLAFSRMLLNGGAHDSTSILSAESVRALTTDQISPEQKARSPFFPGFWDTRGWGLGVSIVTAAEGGTPPGRFGWDGALGTSGCVDADARRIGILLTQRMDVRGIEDVNGAFWRAIYA
jgi:CubicO group peptidase (beta-lactamase class C family)